MLAGASKRRCAVCHASYTRGESFCPLDGGAIVGDETADELVGKTLDGRYLITRVLGRGGMGKVYEADHIGLGKRVAVKLISDTDADRELRARFRQEARAASRIVDEHVVQIFDVGIDGEREYLVMEYVDGRDLDAILRDGPMSPARAIAIAQQILRGLHACHTAGVIHRDIKPSNIRLTNSTDFVKIMDFGIAKSMRAEIAQTDTGTGRAIGTPQYMAPEQILEGTVDHRADIYAVGATLYAMLAGKPPFSSTSFTQRASELTGSPPSIEEVRPGLPPSLVAAITRALQQSPDARFPDALAFADALGDGAVVAEARMVAATKPMAYAGLAPVVRHRRWIPIAIALAALASGALVFAFVRRPAEPAAVAPDAAVVPDAAASVEIDAPLPVTVVDAAIAIDAAPRKTRIAHDPPAGTVIARVETKPPCDCIVKLPKGTLNGACVRKLKEPKCNCQDAGHNRLCPWVITVTDGAKIKFPDGSKSGTMNCVDRTRAECDPTSNDMPKDCFPPMVVAVDDAPCSGYRSGMTATDPRKEGTYRCTICDWAKAAPKFYGKTGDTCVGFEGRTGEKMTGELKCPN